MNRHIKDLLPKPWTFPYPDREMYSKEQMEQFAQALLKECIVMFQEAMTGQEDDVDYGLAEAQYLITKHFGINE